MKFGSFVFEDKNKVLVYILIIIIIIFALFHLYSYNNKISNINKSNTNININNDNDNDNDNYKDNIYIKEKFNVELIDNQILGTSNVTINTLDNVVINFYNDKRDVRLSDILVNIQNNLYNTINSNITTSGNALIAQQLTPLQTDVANNNTSIANFTTSLNTSISTVNNNINLNIPALSIIAYYPPPNTLSPTQQSSQLQNVPLGWQICDGKPLLYANSNGLPTSSNTPDLQCRFILGVGNSVIPNPTITQTPNPTNIRLTNRSLGDNQLGPTGGEETHKLTIPEMPSHFHHLELANAAFRNGWESGDRCWSTSGHFKTVNGYKPLSNTTVGTSGMSKAGDDAPHNNMPPYYVLIYIIKQPL